MTPRCTVTGCDVKPEYELLMPSGDSFSPPIYACPQGAVDYVNARRRLPDSSPGEQHASQPDAVGHGRRAAALRAGVGG